MTHPRPPAAGSRAQVRGTPPRAMERAGLCALRRRQPPAPSCGGRRVSRSPPHPLPTPAAVQCARSFRSLPRTRPGAADAAPAQPAAPAYALPLASNRGPPPPHGGRSMAAPRPAGRRARRRAGGGRPASPRACARSGRTTSRVRSAPHPHPCTRPLKKPSHLLAPRIQRPCARRGTGPALGRRSAAGARARASPHAARRCSQLAELAPFFSIQETAALRGPAERPRTTRERRRCQRAHESARARARKPVSETPRTDATARLAAERPHRPQVAAQHCHRHRATGAAAKAAPAGRWIASSYWPLIRFQGLNQTR